MRVLVAESDASIVVELLNSLRAIGCTVDRVANGSEADAALTLQEFDLLVLSLSTDPFCGTGVLRRLRSRGSHIPVLMLVSAGGSQARAAVLDLGADDCQSKPISLMELTARVRALTRRSFGTAGAIIQYGALSYNTVRRIVSLNGEAIELSRRELSLLEVLLKGAGRLVSKEVLIAHICEWGCEISSNAIEVYVHRLRKKVEHGQIRIATVRGIGYSLQKCPGGSASAKYTIGQSRPIGNLTASNLLYAAV